jgi:hypothetical protein
MTDQVLRVHLTGAQIMWLQRRWTGDGRGLAAAKALRQLVETAMANDADDKAREALQARRTAPHSFD